MHSRIKNKKIIVTGASSGIGERIAWHIARGGGTPIMLARSIDRLNKQQKEIAKTFSTKSYIYQANLQNTREIDCTVNKILHDHSQIHALINNAGMGVYDYIQDIRWEDVEKMMQLNVLAIIRLSQQFAVHFKQFGEGHIVNIGSQAGKISTPKASVYGATKHAVIGFTNALRLEITAKNMYVTSVNLGPVQTNFFQTADPEGVYQRNVKNYMLDPDLVASKVVRHLFTNKREINLPWWMEFGSKIYGLLPGLAEQLLRGQFNKK